MCDIFSFLSCQIRKCNVDFDLIDTIGNSTKNHFIDVSIEGSDKK